MESNKNDSTSNAGKGADAKRTLKSEWPPPWPAGIALPKNGDLEFSVSKGLEVVLSQEAFRQLFAYAYATTSEICCLGSVRREGAKFIIERFYLVKQSGSNAHTELDEEAVAKLVSQLIAEGKKDEAHRIRCWAHSHPGMGVFWSDTDDSTCRNLVTDYLVSIVVSSGFAVKCRIDLGGPLPATLDNVPVKYELPADTEEIKEYAEEVKAKVQEDFHQTRYLGHSLRPGSSAASAEKEVVLEEYCEYCGSWHRPDWCPLVDGQDWYFEETESRQEAEGSRKRAIDQEEFPF